MDVWLLSQGSAEGRWNMARDSCSRSGFKKVLKTSSASTIAWAGHHSEEMGCADLRHDDRTSIRVQVRAQEGQEDSKPVVHSSEEARVTGARVHSPTRLQPPWQPTALGLSADVRSGTEDNEKIFSCCRVEK
jgi:hypothetical protein